MTLRQGKLVFIWGTVVSSVIFLGFVVDSHRQIPKRTNQENLTAQVAHGKWVWQTKNCNDCHTILGIGGYYAPDVTRVMSVRGPDWVAHFLKDPEKVLPVPRKMPNLRMTDTEIADTVAFLTWTNRIDTNNWPPNPVAVSQGGGTLTGTATAGASLFTSLGCAACHSIGGVGGKVGPALDRVADRRDRAWIEAQIKDPTSHNSSSNMPGFPNLTQGDLTALVDYLVSGK